MPAKLILFFARDNFIIMKESIIYECFNERKHGIRETNIKRIFKDNQRWNDKKVCRK